MNTCDFSPDRRYRYKLVHPISPLLTVRQPVFIGLNPSTADEAQLDPTLRRIRNFVTTLQLGQQFTMLNLFAFRATDPKDMRRAVDPVGPANDEMIHAECCGASVVVCCWGAGGGYGDRDRRVLEIIGLTASVPMCLRRTKGGCPGHPLYLPGNCRLEEFAL